MKLNTPPEESSANTPTPLPQPAALHSAAPDEDTQPSARTDGRGRAWLILLALLATVFFMAWLLGFFNV
jgi:hypothetical protein